MPFNIKKIIRLLVLSLPLTSSAFVFVDPVNLVQNTITASNSVTSLLNQARSIQMQLEAYKQDWQPLNEYHYQDIAASIQRLDGITQQGQSLSYAMRDLDAQFRKTYPSYSQSSPSNYQEAYGRWNETTRNTLSNSLQSIGANMQSVQQEETLMQQLKGQSQSAQGRMQVLQVANELSAENVRQLESLKQLIASQSNAQTVYMAQAVSKDAYQQKSFDEVAKQVPTHFPTYHNHADFGKLK